MGQINWFCCCIEVWPHSTLHNLNKHIPRMARLIFMTSGC
jgi:hypothetical protein